MNKFMFLFMLLGLALFSGCNWTSTEKKEATPAQEVPVQPVTEEATESEAGEVTEEAKTVASGQVTKIKNEEVFNKFFDMDKPLIVKFKAKGCVACKEMNSIFKKMASQHTDMNFVTIDVNKDGLKSIVEKYEIKGTPSFVFIKTQGVKETAVGKISEEDFAKKLDENFKE
ncbi:MAG: thioredoxin family protein [Candidatus Babeliales bacterium]